MAYYTLRFPDYATAKAAAQQLGFWSDPEPVYEWQPTGEVRAIYVYRETDTGTEHEFHDYQPSEEEIADGLLEFVRIDEVPAMAQVQVGMTEGSLKTDGQSTDPETGEVFGWSITEIGLNPVDPQHPGEYDAEGNELVPPQRLQGYFVNAVGRLPEAAMAFLAPGGYGCAGVLYAGSVAGAHDVGE